MPHSLGVWVGVGLGAMPEGDAKMDRLMAIRQQYKEVWLLEGPAALGGNPTKKQLQNYLTKRAREVYNAEQAAAALAAAAPAPPAPALAADPAAEDVPRPPTPPPAPPPPGPCKQDRKHGIEELVKRKREELMVRLKAEHARQDHRDRENALRKECREAFSKLSPCLKTAES